VTQEGGPYFTERFMEAWHRLDLRTGRRVKQLHLATMLSERLGTPLSPNTVKGWESGAIPDVETIAAIADLCDVHPAWLAFGLGNPTDPVDGVATVRPPKPKSEGGGDEPIFPAAPRGRRLQSSKPVAAPSRRRKGGEG